MAYVEFLRVRRALLVYAIVVVVTALIVATSLGAGHVHVGEGGLRADHVHVPLTYLLVLASFGSLVFGTTLSRSLNRERATLALAWTRPITRERMALQYMLVDFCGVLAAFVITLVVGSLPLVTTGLIGLVFVDPQGPLSLLSMLGVTAMWYGLVQAATSWYGGHSGLAYALSWGVFIGLIFMAHFSALGPLVSGVVTALNYLNPLAYLSNYHSDNSGLEMHTTSLLPLSEGVRTFASWSIGLAACAIAIFAWKRAEA